MIFQTFVKRCRNGRERPDGIQAFMDVLTDDMPKRLECLGFTQEQYDRWLVDPDYLFEIIHECPMKEAVHEALSNAEGNGADFTNWSRESIALDLIMYCSDFESWNEEDLLPHINTYFEEKQ